LHEASIWRVLQWASLTAKTHLCVDMVITTVVYVKNRQYGELADISEPQVPSNEKLNFPSVYSVSMGEIVCSEFVYKTLTSICRIDYFSFSKLFT